MTDIPKDVVAAAIRALMVPEHEMTGSVALAIMAERERIATHLFDRDAFMTAVSGDGDPFVKVQFKTLAEMQSFYRALVELSAHAIRSQS